MSEVEESGVLKKSLKNIQILRDIEYSRYQQSLLHINERKKKMENEVEQYAGFLHQQITLEWIHLNEQLSKYEKHLMSFQKCSSDINNIADCVFSPSGSISQFVPGQLDNFALSEIFGTLRATENFEIDLQNVHSFETDLTYVNPLCSINDHTLLLGCAVDKAVCRVTSNSRTEIFQSYIDLDVCSFALLDSGGFIFSSSKNETSLKQFTLNESIQVFHNFEPLVPKGLCVTSHGEVIVGLREVTSTPFVVSCKSKRQVHRLDKFGRTRNIYEFDTEKRRLFTLPSRIVTDSKDLFVLDSLSETNGRIVALQIHGNSIVNWVYSGYDFAEFTFCPNDLTLTTRGLIILTDTYNDALHFLNNTGSLLFYRRLNDFGITLPCSVCIDFTGHLWLGSGRKGQNKSRCHKLSIYKS